jgi:hypothetical protein
LSLEARNEKEVQQNPNQVTADAHQGIQKAEAAALVWTKPVLYATFAWYVTRCLVPCPAQRLMFDCIGSGCAFSCWRSNRPS